LLSGAYEIGQKKDAQITHQGIIAALTKLRQGESPGLPRAPAALHAVNYGNPPRRSFPACARIGRSPSSRPRSCFAKRQRLAAVTEELRGGPRRTEEQAAAQLGRSGAGKRRREDI
jgi:hypothetical protein